MTREQATKNAIRTRWHRAFTALGTPWDDVYTVAARAHALAMGMDVDAEYRAQEADARVPQRISANGFPIVNR